MGINSWSAVGKTRCDLDASCILQFRFTNSRASTGSPSHSHMTSTGLQFRRKRKEWSSLVYPAKKSSSYCLKEYMRSPFPNFLFNPKHLHIL